MSDDPRKIVGELDDEDGIGVHGKATGDGETVGVKGEAGSEGGYGLYTPDDARIDGSLVGDMLTGGDALDSLLGDGLDVIDGELTANGGGNGESPDAGRYLEENDELDFVGPAEWENDGETDTNDATDTAATVAGGSSNLADDEYATVSGGDSNAATGEHSSVGGGSDNTASGSDSTIAGGAANEADGFSSFIGGGVSNETGDDASWSVLCGGWNNEVGGERAALCGGSSNEARGDRAFVGGGGGNAALHDDSTVAGGSNNAALRSHATVAGGEDNSTAGSHATVAGGGNNEASAPYATVAGGGSDESDDGNAAVTDHSTVGGGEANAAGDEDDADSTHATVGGGADNEASGAAATVGGGEDNTASGVHATVAGGERNEVTAEHSTIPGGSEAVASQHGQYAYSSGAIEEPGDAQISTYIFKREVQGSVDFERLYLNWEGDTDSSDPGYIPVEQGAALSVDFQGVHRNTDDGTFGSLQFHMLAYHDPDDDEVVFEVDDDSVVTAGDGVNMIFQTLDDLGESGSGLVPYYDLYSADDEESTNRVVATFRTTKVIEGS